MKLQRIVCCAICFALPMFAQTSSKHSSNWQNQNDNPSVQNAVAQRSRWAVETLNTLSKHARLCRTTTAPAPSRI